MIIVLVEIRKSHSRKDVADREDVACVADRGDVADREDIDDQKDVAFGWLKAKILR
jgi:hypothetical protein